MGDTNTDLLVSDGWGFNAYLYAGGAAFTGAGPAVTFQSTVQYFGSSIANLGDVDGDTLDDIGISSAYDSPAKLFIFKGRAVWPATLSDTQADYVITTDSTFDSSALGFPIIKLGDINGDLVGDFALGASAYNNNAGALLVILGKAPFGSGALPGLVGSGRAILLTSPTYPSGNFGVSATVLGASNGTLVVGAITASTNKGQLTAYKWVTGTGLMAVGSPYLGGTGELLGSSLTVLGGGAGLISGDTTGAGSGFALSFLTGTAAMPFGGTTTRFVDSAAPTAFGTLALGGGFSGSNASISYVGDTKPDLIFGAAREGGNAASVYFVDGNDATTATSPVDVTMVARASVKLPADWMQVAFYNSPIKDVNGDGHGDVAIGEADDGTFSVPYRGRVLVLW